MKYAWWLLVLGGVAHAGSIKAPAGWIPNESAAVSLSQRLGAVTHFGDRSAIVTTEVYRSTTGNGALYVTRLVANVPATQRQRAASFEISELSAPIRRAGDTAKRREESRALVVEDKKLVDGNEAWTDTSTDVTTRARMVIVADAQQMVAVVGECVMGAAASADELAACKTALSSIDPGIAFEARVPLSLAATDLTDAQQLQKPPAGSASGPSLVESGERPSLPPMQLPQDSREPDRRPIFVGLGLIVLALVFYWNRKNREKLERQYEKTTADKPVAAPDQPAKSDRDADDLHAAAEDDTKESKS